MENFESLPLEKQNRIIEASLSMFGKLGYKKASSNDIATLAGISKGMIFHYFGNKKNLYMYLLEFAGNTIIRAMNQYDFTKTPDFFDRIIAGSNLEIAIMRKYPSMLLFLGSAFYETDKAVKDDLQNAFQQGEQIRNKFILSETDLSKFKDNVDPNLVINIIVRFTEGYINNKVLDTTFDLDKMMDEITSCLLLMKNNFYKETFL